MVYKKKQHAVVRGAKYVAKAVGKHIVHKALGRYGKSSGYEQLASDVMYLRSAFNAEKKRIDITVPGQALGQCLTNASGWYYKDITPILAENDTYSGRGGASVKLHSSYMKFQFQTQSACTTRIRYKIMIVQVKGSPQTAATAISNMFLPNQWVSLSGTFGVISDWNSMINPDYLGEFKILRTINATTPQPQFAGQTQVCEKVIKHVYGGREKKGHHIRYSGDTATVANGQILLFVIPDAGNASGTISTLSNVVNQTQLSAGIMNLDIKHYYYDN